MSMDESPNDPNLPGCLPEHLRPLLQMSRREALLAIASRDSLIHSLARANGDQRFDDWLPSDSKFRHPRDLQLCALILCARYWQTREAELDKFENKDPLDCATESFKNFMPAFTTPISRLQRLSPPRACRISVPCGGGKSAIVAWLCALRGGNILVGTDSAANARHLLFVLLKQTNLASYVNVKLVRGGEKEKNDSAGLKSEDAKLLKRHTISDYAGTADFDTPLVPDHGIANVVIVDSMLMRLSVESIDANKRLRVALSLMHWNLMIFDECDKFFTQESKKPFTAGFEYSDIGIETKQLKFNVPDAVLMSGTWREGDDSKNFEERNWLKGCGPMLLRILSKTLAEEGILAKPHFHLVACKHTQQSEFGFEIPQLKRTKNTSETFQFGLTYEMLRVIEKIIQLHSLMKGKVMIFSTLEDETRALAAIFPNAITVTGLTESGAKSRYFQEYQTQSSEHMTTKNVWITTSIGGRGTDAVEVTAIVLIGGEATDTKWQQIGRGLRSWCGSPRCEVWDLAPQQVGWANEWIQEPNHQTFKQKMHTIHRLKNVLIEGFADYVRVCSSDECVRQIDDEIERLKTRLEVCEPTPARCTDDRFVAANHAACVALNDFKKPIASTSVAKETRKRKDTAKQLLWTRSLKKQNCNAASASSTCSSSFSSSSSSRSSIATPQRNGKRYEALAQILLQLKHPDGSLVYPVEQSTSVETLKKYREELRTKAEEVAKRASEGLLLFVEHIRTANYGERVQCEFMASEFPTPS